MLHRIIMASIYAALVVVFIIGFATFGWTAANIAAPVNDPNFPLPSWWWTACMVIIALMQMACAIAFTLKTLDELFYPKNDNRRIFHR